MLAAAAAAAAADEEAPASSSVADEAELACKASARAPGRVPSCEAA